MKKEYTLRDGKVVEAPPGNGQVFVYCNPTSDEKRHLIDIFRLDEHTLGSVLDPDELGRVEYEPEHTAIVFKRPKSYQSADNYFFRVATTGFYLFEDKLIVLAQEDDLDFEGRHFNRILTVSDLLLRLLNRHILHFTEHLRIINLLSDELEKAVNMELNNKNLLHMFTLEKSLVYYLNAISSNGRVLKKMQMNSRRFNLSAEGGEYLEDVLIENEQCQEQANTYSQVLSGLMDARASLINNNLTVMMKNLNAIAIAISVPTFIAGLGGMSEFSMMTGADHWMISYPLFCLVNVGLGVLTFYAIRKTEQFWS